MFFPPRSKFSLRPLSSVVALIPLRGRFLQEPRFLLAIPPLHHLSGHPTIIDATILPQFYGLSPLSQQVLDGGEISFRHATPLCWVLELVLSVQQELRLCFGRFLFDAPEPSVPFTGQKLSLDAAGSLSLDSPTVQMQDLSL